MRIGAVVKWVFKLANALASALPQVKALSFCVRSVRGFARVA